MKIKYLGIVALALMLSPAILLANVKAASWPNLPLTQVQLTVVDGTTSYFESTLSGVPLGFDVHNGVYPGWCVDRSVVTTRGVSHNVILYSGLSPPLALSGINWIAINYILNHKQGSMMDVQEAIWHFTDAYSPISATAQAMVNAANANPSYDPMTGEVLAIICLPQNDLGAQNSIIELARAEPDVAVVDVKPEYGFIYQGKLCGADINVTIFNKGSLPESFTVSVYSDNDTSVIGDEYIVGTQSVVDLLPGEYRNITFLWNTANVQPCHLYVITVVATLPGDINPDDNTLASSIKVKVRLFGDVNDDGKVDGKDIAVVAQAFGSYPTHPRWNFQADLNQDSRIEGQDLSQVAKHFGTIA